MRYYRRIVEVKWQDHVTHDEVRKQVQWEWTVIDTIRKRKLQLLGHICTISDNRLLKTLVLGMVEGRNQTGRRHPDVVWSRHQRSDDDDGRQR